MYSIFKTVKKLSNFTTRWRPKNQDNTIAPSSSNAISTIRVDNELDCILRRIASPIPFINFVNEIRLCWLNVWGRERMTLRNSQKLRQASQRRWAKLSENKKEKYKLLAANWSSTRLPLSLLTKTRSELGQYEATRSSHSLPSSPSSSSLAFVPEFNRSSPTRRRQSPTMTTRQATRRTLRRVVQSPRSQRVATASRAPRSARSPRGARVPRLQQNKRIPVDQRASTLILQRSIEAERDRAEAEIEAMSRALVAPPLIMSLPTTPVQPAVENSVPRNRVSKRLRLVQPVNPRMPVPIPSMEVVELKKPRTLRKAKNVESNAFTMPENIETKSVDPKALEFPETIEAIALPKKSRASRKKTEFTENFQIIESAPRDLEFPETSMAPTRKLRGRPKKVESTAPELPETFQSMAPSKKPRVSRKSKNVESIEVRTPEDIEMIESPPRTLELPETSMASTRKLRKRPMKVKSTALELSENFQSMAPLKKPRVSRNSKNVESIEVRTPEDIEMIESPPRALELPETSMAPTRKLRKRPKKVKSTALELPETFQSMAPQKKPRVSRKSKNVETNAAKSLDPKSKSMELTALRKPRRSRSLEVKRNRTVPKKRKQSLDVIEVDSSREIFHSLSSHLDRFNGLPKRSTGSLFAIVSSEHVTVKRR